MKLIELFETILPRCENVLSLTESEVNVRWAVGTNSNKASVVAQQDMQDPIYIVVWLPIKDVMQKTLSFQRLDVNDPVGGVNAIGCRVARAREYWQDGGFMDPSLLTLDEASDYKVIAFSDGRHRMIAAHRLGEEWAPAIVPKNMIIHLKKLMEVRKINFSIMESILDITENIKTSTYGAWYDVNTDTLYNLDSLSNDSPHVDWLLKNLKLIGETKENLELIDKTEQNEYIYQKAKDYGLVRIVYPGISEWKNASSEYDINGNLEPVKKYLKKYRQQILQSIKAQEIDHLLVEIGNDTHTFDFDSWDGLEVAAELREFNKFVRTGSITENTETSTYGAWYDANTNKLYDLGPYGGSGLSPHQLWLIDNLELIGETKEDLYNKDEDFDYIYKKAKDYGLVRIIYPEDDSSLNDYNIEGNIEPIKKYLKKYHRLIIQSVNAEEIDTLYVEANDKTYTFEFDLDPNVLRKFNKFVRN